MRAAQGLFGVVPFDAFGAQVDQQQVGVGAVCDRVEPAFDQLVAECLGVLDDLLDVGLELGLERFTKGHGLGRDHMHQRAPLNTREDGRVELFRQRFVVGQDHAAARTAQGFMCGGCRHMRMGEGGRVFARSDQTGKMGHVHLQVGTDHIGNLAHPLEVDLARNGGTTGDDQLGLVLFRERFDLVIVKLVVLFAHAVLDGIEPFAGLVRLGPVGQVAARVEAHAQNGVTGLQQRGEHALVGLAARIRLHVGEIAVEQFARAFNRQVFRHIDKITPAIIAAARVAFGIFVGHHRPLRRHDSRRHDVLGGDQFDLVTLATQLVCNGPKDFGIGFGQGGGEKTGHGRGSFDYVCGLRAI